MNTALKILLCIAIGAVLGVGTTLWIQTIRRQTGNISTEEEVSIKWRQNHFILSEENLYNELIAQGVDFPEIVKAQAILETGHFKSNACLQHNNLFGLRGRDNIYMHFDHWTDAVAAYKKFIQKYVQPPSNYYDYLKDLDYAEDPDYLTKLKQLVNK